MVVKTAAGFSDDEPEKEPQDEAERRIFRRKKANRFLEHAKIIMESKQFDYAIECFIAGLQYAPDDLAAHQLLRDAAKRRKTFGGKPASFGERIKIVPRFPVEKMLQAESLWSKDPSSGELAANMLRRAEAVQNANLGYDMAPVIEWLKKEIEIQP